MQKTMQSKIMEVLEKNKRVFASRELLRKVKGRNKTDFYDALHALQASGKIVVDKKHKVTLCEPASFPKAVMVSLSRGFGFARLLDGGEDVFVHADDLKGAFVGDTVMLRNVRQTPKGAKGAVECVLERSGKETTGTVVRKNGVYDVIPDAAYRFTIPIDLKGKLKAKDGDKVLVQLYHPSRTDKVYAKLLKIYGKSQSARICADAIIDQNGIPTTFSAEVLAQADRAAAEPVSEEEIKKRLDLRDMAICTIDGADAKDLDDAVFVSRTRDGFKLGVHIADVSHYVTENSAIDAAALERGTSVYFADRVIPMLPKQLSNGACSLNAGEDKLTFSALIRLDREGTILSYEFKKSVINSKVRGVYSEVNQLFSKMASPEIKQKYAPVARSLSAARELAQILKDRSRMRGTMDFESGESRFTLDENGVCVDVQPRTGGEAEEMIEQLMIAANQAAAMLAREKQIPFVYRIHENPNPDRVHQLAQMIDAIGLNSRSIKKENPGTTDFAAILKQASGTPLEKIVSHQMLRTMEKAKYGTSPSGHFGLALKDYCHFTSPIRRYPDLAIHRILSALCKGEKKEAIEKQYAAFAEMAAAESSAHEVRALTAERSAEDCYMAEYMCAYIGEEYEGVVSGVTQRGIFVELPNSVEGFVSIDSFEDADYQFDGMITQIDRRTGKKLTIGTPMRILVVSADVATGRIDFAPNLK